MPDGGAPKRRSGAGPRQYWCVRLGIAHHLGWAVVVAATADHEVADRRRIELLEPGLQPAPIHHEGGPHTLHRLAEPLDDIALARLVADVRAATLRATSAALDKLAAELPEPIVSMSVRAWPEDFPEDIAVQRRVPYESRADSVMYRQVLADLAANVAGWSTSTTPRRSRTKPPASWEIDERRCFAARGHAWDRLGQRTIESHSPRRSSLVSPRASTVPRSRRKGQSALAVHRVSMLSYTRWSGSRARNKRLPSPVKPRRR